MKIISSVFKKILTLGLLVTIGLMSFDSARADLLSEYNAKGAEMAAQIFDRLLRSQVRDVGAGEIVGEREVHLQNDGKSLPGYRIMVRTNQGRVCMFFTYIDTSTPRRYRMTQFNGCR